MRLGEIKNIIARVTNENGVIITDHQGIFGDQAYIVKNFQEIAKVFEIINDLPWNDIGDEQMSEIVKKYRNSGHAVQLEQSEFNNFNAYIAELNNKLPFFYSILKTMTEEQDTKVINIKLPNEKYTLESLNSINKRLEKILMLFNIDGEFVLEGFDVGTAWYVMCAQGLLSWSFLIACLKVGQECMKLTAEYFKSQEAKINYEVAKQNKQDMKMSEYQDAWLKIYIEDKIKEIMKEINDTNGTTHAELEVKLLKGTKALIKELGVGTEFHLSLNPPDYANEEGRELIIDYKKIREIRNKEAEKLGNDKPKELAESRELESKNEGLDSK